MSPCETPCEKICELQGAVMGINACEIPCEKMCELQNAVMGISACETPCDKMNIYKLPSYYWIAQGCWWKASLLLSYIDTSQRSRKENTLHDFYSPDNEQ